jgi:branched-chain amino acid transport system substrate-binding protein
MPSFLPLSIRNKKGMLSITLAAMLVVITACGSGATQGETQGQTPTADLAPVKIGVLLPQSGTYGALSDSAKKGMELYLEQHKNMLGNRKVEIKYEDDEANPQVGIRKYRQLVDNSKVDIIAGSLASAVSYALRDQVDQDKMVMFTPAAADGLSWEKKSNYVFKLSYSSWQFGTAAVPYIIKNAGKTAYIISSDVPFGHEAADAFKRAYTAAGGTVVEEKYFKHDTLDFSTYITQISQLKPDLVFGLLGAGITGTTFLKQYKEFGLTEKIPVYSNMDELTFAAVGDASVNNYAISPYSYVLTSDMNKKFVEAYKAKFNKNPDMWSNVGYDMLEVIAKAVEKAGSLKSDDLVGAIKGLNIDSPRGPITIDPKTNSPIIDMYILKNVMKDGKLVPESVETVKQITIPENKPSK